MCGIIGIIGKESINKKLAREMNDRIAHRGPDDEGFFYNKNIALAMRRLAIIDIEKGKQPITSDDSRYTIVFNGEIYNYKDLRYELEMKGANFKTNSDTEVLLQLYIFEKEKMLSKLRGMFAFAIHDRDSNSIFLARDYFGIKPLYYLLSDDKIVAFGSEIKSLLLYPGFKKQINDEAVYNYLLFQYNPLQETFFKGIWKLPPGHYMQVDLNTGIFKKSKYWSFEFEPEQISAADMKDSLRNTLENSVRTHMIADVPVGSFLSGGIDSSIIASLASKVSNEHNGKLSTFTIGFKEVNEWNTAEETAKAINSEHQNVELSWDDYFKSLPQIAWHFDEPVADPSAVALYFLAREARKKVKVVLSGEGADELFGGYNIYLEPFARAKLQYIPRAIRKFAYTTFVGIFPNMRGVKFLERSLLRTEDWYIGNASIFSEQGMKNIWNGNKYSRLDLVPYYKQVKEKSESIKMQYIDINTWLVGDILAKADKMTMAHSLELRVPFLDIKLAAITSKMSDKLKWKENKTKYLLREASRNIVPETTRIRKKLGFPTPIVHMISQNHFQIKKQIIENMYVKNHFNIENINNLFVEHLNKRKDNSRKIYALLMLSIWHQVFFSE